jgi:CheY-like chemotaxis protein
MKTMVQPLTVLLAEDDQGHASLVLRNLTRAGIANDLVHVGDGQEALDYVRCTGSYADRTPSGPLLLLLDINMPRVDGVEVLRGLKADVETKRIPVIMLTTTDDPREIERCYKLGCSVYLTKPVEYGAFVEAVRRLGLLLQIVSVPNESAMIGPRHDA